MTLKAVGDWNGKDKPCGCAIAILEESPLRVDIQFCKVHAEAEATLLQNDKRLRVMNDLHSLLSLIRHRHLPIGLDLERDIDKALGASSQALQEWWAKQLAKASGSRKG